MHMCDQGVFRPEGNEGRHHEKAGAPNEWDSADEEEEGIHQIRGPLDYLRHPQVKIDRGRH